MGIKVGSYNAFLTSAKSPSQKAPEPVGTSYHTRYTVTSDALPTQKCAPTRTPTKSPSQKAAGSVGIPYRTRYTVTSDAPPTQKCAEADPVGISYHTNYTVTSDAPPTQKCAEAPTQPSDEPPTRTPAESPSQKAAEPGSSPLVKFGVGCLIVGLVAACVYKLRSRNSWK